MNGILYAAVAAAGALAVLGTLALVADWWMGGTGRKVPADRLPFPVVAVLTLVWAVAAFIALCLTAIYATRLFLELVRFAFGWPA